MDLVSHRIDRTLQKRHSAPYKPGKDELGPQFQHGRHKFTLMWTFGRDKVSFFFFSFQMCTFELSVSVTLYFLEGGAENLACI